MNPFPTTTVTHWWLKYVCNNWCAILVITLASKAGAQEVEDAGVTSDLPEQVLQGMDMSHSSYRLDAFNCDQPEDVVTQSIPESCNTDNEEPEEDKMEADSRQDYTILQKVTAFEYTAMLCNLHRSGTTTTASESCM